MVQMNRKTNVIALAIVLCLVFAFGAAAAIFAVPATETAYAIDNVAQFHFYGISGNGSKTDGGITFNYSGSYYIPGGTSCIVLEAGGSFTLTVSASALQNKNITKVKYSLTENYASGAGEGNISVRLKRGSTSKSTSMQTSSNGVSISGSGNLTFTITNSSKTDRSKAYNFGTNFTLMAPSQVAVTVSAGTGVKEVFLSTAQDGSSAATSGSTFGEGSTVYAFGKLEKGYQAKSGWTLVSGNANSEDAVYRTGSKKISTSDKDFGTISADTKTKSLVLDGNGIENGTNVNLIYGQSALVGALERTGYHFLGWNTMADGTGVTYGDAEGASLSSEQVNTIIDDASITSFYAMWKADINTIIAMINSIGEVEYTEACKDAIVAARSAYDSLDAVDQALVTNYTDLTDAEAIYASMEEDAQALDEYKITAKGNADEMAEENDSAICEQLIADAKDAIDVLVYDCTKTLEENKALVDAILSALENDLNDQRTAEGVDALIDALPDPVTTADKDAINAVRGAYNALTVDQKTRVENLDELTDAEAALNVAELIDAIGDPVTLADKNAIKAARDAYNALNEAQQESVGNYDDLLDAEADYVAVLINAIGDAADTEEYRGKVENARAEYNALTSDQKANFPASVLKVLTDDEAAISVMDDINAIGAVAYNSGSYHKIFETARPNYNALTDEQKALVANYDKLTAAEAQYNDMKAANSVKNLIDAIGEVAYPDTKADLDAAREAYDALDDDAKQYVSNYETLTDAEETFVENVEDIIDAIGAVEYSEACEEKIDAANEAYGALSDHLKSLVDNADELEQANDDYDSVDDAVRAINSIGTVYYNDEIKNCIDDARGAYDDLSQYQKSIFPEDVLQVLIDDEKAYEAMGKINAITYPLENTEESLGTVIDAEDYFNGLTDEQQERVRPNYISALEDAVAVKKAIEAVNAIGDVEYTLEEEGRINTARTLVDALNDKQADILPESILKDLEDKEEVYNALGKIDAIGDVELTPESLGLIEDARDAYDTLTDDQQALVDAEKLQELIDAEKAYEAMRLIDVIGEVVYTNECKALIDAAREYYDALTPAQQVLVDNYDDLVAAEEAYKALDDEAKANAAKALIEAIGEVEYSEESKNKIDEAREAYEALSEDQKELVGTLTALETAESTYVTLCANNEAAARVIELIETIGEVEYTEESKNKIDAAREAYNSLTEEQKALVETEKVAVLTVNEEKYDDLTDRKKAQDVKTLIASIGEVEFTEECKNRIDAARKGYDALTETQKAYVDNYATLTDAEQTYEELTAKKIASDRAAVIAPISVFGCVSIGLLVVLFLLLFKRKKEKENEEEPKGDKQE